MFSTLNRNRRCRIRKKHARTIPVQTSVSLLVVLLLLLALPRASAQGLDDDQDVPADLTELSLEELTNIKITSASKKAEKLSETAAAVYVLTREDIRRSGATTVPELLRMVPGLHVARIDSNTWAITARGFNNQYANKLLVLIDGRSVYTPLFSGVYWDVQDTMIEDIDRIEVIRGPGATVWGANAVNGVINIITCHSRDTQGGLAAAHAGNEEQGFGSARYGGAFSENAWFRIYGKTVKHDNSETRRNGGMNDEWNIVQGGFRVDWDLSESDSLTFQGDTYKSRGNDTLRIPLPPFPSYEDDVMSRGSNVLGRWERTFSETSILTMQMYYDRYELETSLLPHVNDIVDIELQQQFALGDRQEIVCGLGYRALREDADNTMAFALFPDSRHDNLFSAFIQDEISIVDEMLRLTVGSKFEHNDYTGYEIQPTLRLLWTPREDHAVWAAASRAVRTPSTIEADGWINQLMSMGGATVPVVLNSSDDYKSENLTALEIGYRISPTETISFDLATFLNCYDNLRTLELISLAPIPTFRVDNMMDGHTYGAELAADWLVRKWCRIRGAYTFHQVQLSPDNNSRDLNPEAGEDETPHHQISLRSYIDLPYDVELDAGVRYVDRLSSLGIGNYTGFDLRLGWMPVDGLDLSLVGQNLFRSQHAEYAPFFSGAPASLVERSIYIKVTWRF